MRISTALPAQQASTEGPQRYIALISPDPEAPRRGTQAVRGLWLRSVAHPHRALGVPTDTELSNGSPVSGCSQGPGASFCDPFCGWPFFFFFQLR